MRQTGTSSRTGSPVILLLLGALAVLRAAAEPAPWDYGTGFTAIRVTRARKEPAIPDLSAYRAGFVVGIGLEDDAELAGLRRLPGTNVHGLSTDPATVLRVRENLVEAGLNGPVSVEVFDGQTLPYADNLVNLLVCRTPGQPPPAEILRVLAPGGNALVRDGDGWREIAKPVPAETDDWTHYLHDTSNNAVSADTVVAPPRRVQWLGSPAWSRHHDRMASTSALVAADGRIFFIVDEGSRAAEVLPPDWKLVARDAYNGAVLWKRDIPEWHFHLWPLKSGPAQLPRRLVAVGDRVFVTLGLHAPVSILDARTGDTLRDLQGTENTEEILVRDGTVYALTNDRILGGEDFVPDATGVWNDTRRVAADVTWDSHKARRLLAADAADGRVLWTVADDIAPLSPAVDGSRVYYHDGEHIAAVDRRDGKPLWKSVPTGRRNVLTHAFAPTLVVHDGVVLFAGGDNKVTAVDAETGRKLWDGEHHPSGHSSPRDLLVLDGLAWSGAIANGKNSGVFTGRDLRSGEIRKEFTPDVETYWFHHRCYRSKATVNYILPSRTGIEFVDFRKEHWDINHWVRGGCIYGIMPANGLIYAPPHSCACYLESKQYGFNVLAPAAPGGNPPDRPPPGERLERGPAYGPDEPGEPAAPTDWPTYRHDPGRSAATPAVVGTDLTPAWNAEIAPGRRLTAPVVSGNRILVADCDAHTLYALNGDSGATLWRYTAGGRIDSPPTVSGGRAIFGSRDGYLTCLRLRDGALVWRFRGSPEDRRIFAFEQLESVWPLHGSVLVRDGIVYAVAGRSMFLDGGLRFLRIEAETGRLLSEEILDNLDPNTGKDLQEKTRVLNMPVALPDVLSSDGKYVYMRSQRFGFDGKREEVTPAPAEPPVVAQDQEGEDRHLFCPIGFLDDSWFHRSYWVYGRRYSSGCNWWHSAGRYTPSGRLLAFTDELVFGYGRQPSYFRWSVPLEYHLFGCSRDPEALDTPMAGESEIEVTKTESLNPANRPISVAVWVKPLVGEGVVLARGGASHGYALVLNEGKPAFLVRAGGTLHTAEAPTPLENGRWTHLAGTLAPDGSLRLFMDGREAATAPGSGLIAADPNETMQIGYDKGSPVGTYKEAPYFRGALDEVRIWRRPLAPEEAAALAAGGADAETMGHDLVLRFSFDRANARDDSGNGNHGGVGATPAPGRFDKGMQFNGPATGRKGGGNEQGGTSYLFAWSEQPGIHVRALALTPDVLFAAGPPDVLDEDAIYRNPRDPELLAAARAQDAAFRGTKGGFLLAYSTVSGDELARIPLDSPPVWDSLAAVPGKLVFTTLSGSVRCYTGK